MTNKNPYYPFSLSRHENSSSILLTDLKWDTFEQAGFLGNGHDWNRLISNLLKEKLPNVLPNLEFDSESDMFCVRSNEEELLQKIAEIVSSFYDEENMLEEYISRYAQYG